ncbi:hypothetical protein L6164_029983 [Bauhinia variegata]|uniref:Uncharacterized protein n=1 Tax=Bauhinia variegata TaxID=167791 RepID=A0ACB9LAD0_BAUVA|nr:hypothetical protein L6164_029983 [Bauhinia variegata]
MMITHADPMIICSSTSPSWKLYENPFYNSQEPYESYNQQLKLVDLNFFRSMMDCKLEFARAKILDMKAELDNERKACKKLESVNRTLSRKLAEERRGREALERVCLKLAKEASSSKMEAAQMKKEMEEGRKMVKIAEILREERVQMKLNEAKNLYEERLAEIENGNHGSLDYSKTRQKNQQEEIRASPSGRFSENFGRLVSVSIDNGGSIPSPAFQRRESKIENPHIKRGIKGFVEFPRVVRQVGSKSKHWGTKLECQKAQISIFLRQRSGIRSNSIVIS